MWAPSIGIAELIFRGVVVYLVLFALIRLVGKKHVGELSPFDLVVLLIISETVSGSLTGGDHSLTGGLISAATLLVIVQVVGYLTWRYRRVERWVDGVPKILVRHGRINKEMMRQEQVTRAELVETLRKQGFASVRNVRFAIIETDGSISAASREAAKK